ncbi:hypothetical protein BUE80_DR008604 [Diplocarpon rosae]|nr:hypothetical protein BUE80_DR008604 [Diplocarpon rosae]
MIPARPKDSNFVPLSATDVINEAKYRQMTLSISLGPPAALHIIAPKFGDEQSLQDAETVGFVLNGCPVGEDS